MRRFLAATSLSLLLFCSVPAPVSAAPLEAPAGSPWSLLRAWMEDVQQAIGDFFVGVTTGEPPAREGRQGRLLRDGRQAAGSFGDSGPGWDPDGSPATIASRGDSGPGWDPDGAF